MAIPLDYLNALRRRELAMIVNQLRPGAHILEVGAGTGAQARDLAELGFKVTAIDLDGSAYRGDRIHPVTDYDGATLPTADRSVDIVFSSNVLEHVREPATFHRECRRVLRADGYCVHIVPSAAWRFWTSVAAPLSVPRRLAGPQRSERLAGRLLDALKPLAAELFHRPHGERGDSLSELYTFSRAAWLRHFRRYGWRVETVEPVRIFYTGQICFGARLDQRRREQLSRWLGSASNLFRIVPGGAAEPLLQTARFDAELRIS